MIMCVVRVKTRFLRFLSRTFWQISCNATDAIQSDRSRETDRHKDGMKDNQPNAWNTHNQIQLSMNWRARYDSSSDARRHELRRRRMNVNSNERLPTVQSACRIWTFFFKFWWFDAKEMKMTWSGATSMTRWTIIFAFFSLENRKRTVSDTWNNWKISQLWIEQF